MFILESRNIDFLILFMPLQLLRYSHINGKKKISLTEEKYDQFGKKVIWILFEKAEANKVEMCEMMTDIRIMRRLLWVEYWIEAISKPRKIPTEQLRLLIWSKWRACIIDGVSRYFIVSQKL